MIQQMNVTGMAMADFLLGTVGNWARAPASISIFGLLIRRFTFRMTSRSAAG